MPIPEKQAPRILRERSYTSEEMVSLGATGKLSEGFERYIPVTDIVVYGSDVFQPEPLPPLEVTYLAEVGRYKARAGLSQLIWAQEQGLRHVLAFVEPSEKVAGAIGDKATCTCDEPPNELVVRPDIRCMSPFWWSRDELVHELHSRLHLAAITKKAIHTLWHDTGPENWLLRVMVQPDYADIQARYRSLTLSTMQT